ncbi:MAG: endo-1,4-beta-xylanase [Defluviitaleaceae bacterium]|nr:endo-1,4-beta-xylanase [Defluviitaleaceae bacterium]
MVTWDLSLPSLCRAFEKYFKIGNILAHKDWEEADTLEMFKHHYNALTPENCMKPEYMSKAKGEYFFDNIDKHVDFAEKNGMDMIGHTFVWHAQSALWLNRNEDETPVTRAEARANMEAFIKEYAGRYSGKIHSWDVINEAFIDSGGEEPFKGSWRSYIRRETDNPRAVGHWFLAYANGADVAKGECGSDYVFDSFYFARKYDPKAILYYNDYNEEFDHKCTIIPQMVNEINEQWKKHPEYDGRMLIEGIGMQSHHNHQHTDIERIRRALEAFIKTGAKISITEMDFTFGSSAEPANPLSPENAAKQTEMYVELFKLYMEYSKHIERVSFWGTNDLKSWRSWGAPTFFDNDSQAKDVFHKVIALTK